MSELTKKNTNEFWFHVAKQEEIPIAGIIDSSFDLKSLISFLDNLPDKHEFKEYLKKALSKNIDFLDILRQLIGVSDKRMYLELSLLFGRSTSIKDPTKGLSGDSVYNINSHPLKFFKKLTLNTDRKISASALDLLIDYLISKEIQKVIYSFNKLNEEELQCIIAFLINPKEVQQKQAKRRGHGAEQELAKLLSELGCNFFPEDRHEDPMKSQDPSVNKETFNIMPKKEKGTTWSFDLVINKNNKSIVFVQSLIHTSDPGQYGVNKSDETVSIKEDILNSNDKFSTSKELWGLVDGFGFAENKKDTINKMLSEFDCFVQLKTLYKAGLRLHKLGLIKIKGIKFDESFYNDEQSLAMYEKYCSKEIVFLNEKKEISQQWREIQAGKANIYI